MKTGLEPCPGVLCVGARKLPLVGRFLTRWRGASAIETARAIPTTRRLTIYGLESYKASPATAAFSALIIQAPAVLPRRGR